MPKPGADIVYGIVQPGPPLDEGVPYVRGKDIQNNEILIEQLWRTSDEIAADYERSRISTGDVLLCIIRHLKVAIVPAVLDGGNLSRTTARLRPSQVLTTEYLAGALRSPFCQGWLKSKYRSGTSMPKVNIADACRLPIPVPPLNEQRRIVAKIEALYARSRRAKEALDAIPPLLDRLRQSILAAAFRGDLTADWRAQHPDVEPADKLLERIRTERRRRWEEAQLAKMRAKGKEPKNDKWKSKYKEPAGLGTQLVPEIPGSWTWASLDTLTLIQGYPISQ